MSRKGNCYDNAFMESFWSTLKLELVYRRDFTTYSQARAASFDYIEAFYNRQRRHTALDFLSPANFETKKMSNRSLSFLCPFYRGKPKRRLPRQQ